MRITLTLHDDVHQAAKTLAKRRSITLGEAVSELVRRGVELGTENVSDSAIPTLQVPPDAPRDGLRNSEMLEGER